MSAGEPRARGIRPLNVCAGGADIAGMALDADAPDGAGETPGGVPARSQLSILVINGDLPPRDRDAGSLRLFRILEILCEDGHAVTLLGRLGFGQERAAAQLAALGVDVFPIDVADARARGANLPGAGFDLGELLAARRFDVAVLSFYEVAEHYLPQLRALSPFTRVIIDTVDIHHIRERRGAELSGDPVALAGAERTRGREEAIYRQADAVVAVTADDAQALAELAPGVPRFIVPTIHDSVPPTPGFAGRAGVVFVGSFPHAPNVDAVLDFHRGAWPLIRAALPGVRLMLIGTEPPPPVQALSGPDVLVSGWVPEVAPYLDAARVSIAPIRFGAGIKGKIGEALSRGLPVVTTSIGAEGMGLVGGEHALVADAPEEFAAAVVALHEDQELWDRLRRAGRDHVEERQGSEAARAALRDMLSGTLRTPFVLPATAPGMSAAIGAYAHAFASGDPASLVLTVPAGETGAAQAALHRASGLLAEHGIDPETVADIQIAAIEPDGILPSRAVSVAEDGDGPHVAPDGPAPRWRELAAFSPARRRPRRVPRAAIVLHALGDPRALAVQLQAVRAAGPPEDIDLVVVADAPGAELSALLGSLGDARVIRGSMALGRHHAWQLGALATAAPFVITLAPLALPGPGLVPALLAPLAGGAAVVGPVVAGAAGLRVAGDGSLWPRHDPSDGPLDALPLDCLAGPRELFAEGLPPLARGEGTVEAQLGRWLAARGEIAVAAGAMVTRMAAPAATVIVCTRNRAHELPDGIALLLLAGAQEVVIVDNDSSDETPAVAAELAARSGGVVRVVHEPRGGLCHARNAGAAAASHDLLLYIDDDARPAPGWLEHLAGTLARPGVANAGGPISALWPPERAAGWPGREHEPLLSVLDLGDTERTLTVPDVVYGANWAVRRDALAAVGGFDPDFGPGPEARINGDEVGIAWRLHRRGLGTTVYAPGGAVGHRIPAARVDGGFLMHRALCVGVERPRHAHALGDGGPDRLLAGAEAAARIVLSTTSLQGEMTVAEALERIGAGTAALGARIQTAIALGELGASVALLGETEVLLGDLRLQIDGDALLRGVLDAPAPLPA